MQKIKIKIKIKIKEALILSSIFLIFSMLPVLFESIGPIELLRQITNRYWLEPNKLYFVLLILAKIASVHFVFFAIHVLFINILKIKSGVYSFCFLLYTYFHVLIYTPQLLADYIPVRILAPLASMASSVLLNLISCGIFIFFLYSSIRKSKHSILAVLLSSIFLFWTFYLNDPYRTFERDYIKPKLSWNTSTPHIIFLGIDGLRPEALNPFRDNPRYPYLAKFLREAQVFKNVITPVARTFPSIISILSGRAPFETGIRGNLQFSATSAEIDSVLSKSEAEKLRLKGYKFTLGLSDDTHAHFKPGKFISTVLGPEARIESYLLPHFIRDHLLFGWLNNSVGLKILPELIENGAFADTWWPQVYRNQVIENLAMMGPNDGPQFKLFHLVKPHWPNSSRYPFYHIRKPSPLLSSPFGYGTIRDIMNSIPTTTLLDVEENWNVYKSSIYEVVESYLEPVLAYLYNSEIMNSSVVALFSDHGEAFYDGQLLPISKQPKHGSSLVFGDDSEKSFFAIRVQKSKMSNEEAEKPFNLMDALRVVEDVAGLGLGLGQKSEVFSETDRWVQGSFPGQPSLSLASFDEIGLDDSSLPYVNFNEFNQMSRQRAVYDGDFRLTLFFTVFGFQLNLEHLSKNDGNLMRENKVVTERLFEKLKKIYAKDFRLGYLPDLYIDWNSTAPHVLAWKETPEKLMDHLVEESEKWLWQIYMRSLNLRFYEIDIEKSARLLRILIQNLASKNNLDPELKVRSQTELFSLAAFYGVAPKIDLNDIDNAIFAKSDDRWSSGLRKRWNTFKVLALESMGQSRRAHGVQNNGHLNNEMTFLSKTAFPTGLIELQQNLDDLFFVNWRVPIYARNQGFFRQSKISETDHFLKIVVDMRKDLTMEAFKSHLSEFGRLRDEQTRWGIFGINDSWYNQWISSKLKPQFRIEANIDALSDPLIKFETLALIELSYFITPNLSAQNNLTELYYTKIAMEKMDRSKKTKLLSAMLYLRFSNSFFDKKLPLTNERISDLSSMVETIKDERLKVQVFRLLKLSTSG